ncbi:TDT family transporter [Endozoicomonas sp. GU-1]|uniref:TDT family transporter n=1 Tax=Endozoicomonas sp. GU-1 TaxID=3009078 RepID=UPI0022B34E65|nr:TDT family transporter [Endozoicomonas sp. GU-1]WBA80569.1 TDT family transporter [Endozoicomonas sp. GU-1]WBA88137.1 TDT family transporter [Endozoicomonas sp. GU-1]
MRKMALSVRFRNVPTPLGGLALGIASLGAVWALVLPDFAGWFKLSSALVASLLVLAIILKFVSNPGLFREDLAHPVVSSVMPTCAMASMVIAQSLLMATPAFARGLWLLALVAHLLLFISFTAHRFIDFHLHQMVPSWFVPPVGIIVAAVTSKGMGHEELVFTLFVFGLCCYFIKLPVMLYRLIFREKIPDAALPTFAIMAAPASLSLAGYLSITDQPNYLLVAVLLPLAIFMTSLVYVAFVRLLRLPFSPGYAAFTFPMVIGATALFKLADILHQQGYQKVCDVINNLAGFELLVATVIVLYVALRYLWYYFSPRHP